ncbi:MAG: porin [Gemmatimonadales bacterium]|nr:porin [Gemmatimonadales bacterium]
MRIPTRSVLGRAAGAVLLLAAAGHRAFAQTPTVHIVGRVQTQFSAVTGDSTSSFNPNGVVASGFEVRRLRLDANVEIGENVSLVMQPAFEMGALRMRDAYVRVRVAHRAGSAVALMMGQFKKPFNRYELNSSNNLPSIERGARLRGLAEVAAQNNLLLSDGYIAQDLGAALDGSFLEGRVTARLGVFNGAGESAAEVNNAKTVGVRATATVLRTADGHPQLNVGAAFLTRDRAVTTTATGTAFSPDSSHRASAAGLDAEWGGFRPGLHFILDLASGDHLDDPAFRYDAGRNEGNLRPNAPDSAFSTFRSVQIVGAWRVQLAAPAGTRLVKIIEPALRVDLTDPDADRDDDAGMLVTAVLNLYFTPTTVMRAGLDWYRYRDAAGASRSIRAFRLAWQASF